MMNLANKLTVLRIFLVPIFLMFVTVKGFTYGTIIATIIFIVAALTDKLDGYIARSRNEITRFGKFMDPLADKLLVTTALISLVEFGIIRGWVAVVIIAREFAVTGLRMIASADGIVIAASNWGKAKTVSQIIAIVFALLNLSYSSVESLSKIIDINNLSYYLNIATKYSMYIAVIITIISGIDYFHKNKNIIKTDV